MIDVIKQVLEALLERKKLTTVVYGTIESINPLTVRIDAKKLLQSEDLLLSHLVRDYAVDITVQHSTDSIYGSWNTNHGHPNVGSAPIPIEHEHEYTGRKKILLHYGLVEGEKVALIRIEGGQMYYIIDRLEDPMDVKGEWI